MELGNLSLRTHFLWVIRVYEATNNPPGGDIVENHVLMVNLQTLPIVLMFRGKVVMSFRGWFEECMRLWHIRTSGVGVGLSAIMFPKHQYNVHDNIQ